MKNNFSKYIGIVAVIAVVFLLGVYSGRSSVTPSAVNLDQAETKGTALLTIDYGDGTIETYDNLTVASGMKVFDILTQIDDENMKIGYKNYGEGLGIFVESMNGVGPDPAGEKWWQYWINDKYATEGVSSLEVNPGDILEFKFTNEKVQ